MKTKVFLSLFLLLSGVAFGQEQYGNIRGVVLDDDGNPLPGTTLLLESAKFPSRSALSSEGGIFRFINLSPGIYSLRCELAGFKTHVREVIDIRAGTNFDFRVVLTPATLEEQVTVIGESPIVDTKKTGTVTNVTQDMLQRLPSARDPWVILQQAPGLLADRENVGGSSSGQQSLIAGRGGMMWNTQWNMDGVPITDTVAMGSPMSYDFDTFEEMTIVTAGQDATLQTGGVAINIITNRGGNKFQALARTFFTNDKLQGDNMHLLQTYFKSIHGRTHIVFGERNLARRKSRVHTKTHSPTFFDVFRNQGFELSLEDFGFLDAAELAESADLPDQRHSSFMDQVIEILLRQFALLLLDIFEAGPEFLQGFFRLPNLKKLLAPGRHHPIESGVRPSQAKDFFLSIFSEVDSLPKFPLFQVRHKKIVIEDRRIFLRF